MICAMLRASIIRFTGILIAIGLLTAIAPAEKTLGANVRIVYLHGAWVWVALIAIGASGLTGVVGLVARRDTWQRSSLALGRTGLCFWITYLPLSLWAMQANWNGLFLAEPRWRIAVVFAIGGLLLQVGLFFAADLRLASAVNLLYAGLLFGVLQVSESVLHPGSPIFGSDAVRIQLYFLGLVALSLLAGWQVTRWWQQVESPA